jgi:Ca2+-binding EF-hand superfamily protein
MPNTGASDGTAKDRSWLLSIFDRHDLNRDSRVTLGEFIRMIKWLDGSVSTEQCTAAFDLLDRSQRGTVDFDAFFVWWSRRAPYESKPAR